MDDYTFEKEKDSILSDYFKSFHKAFSDERNVKDSELFQVLDEIKAKYNDVLKKLYLDGSREYNENTFDEEYQKGKSKYCR